MANNQFNITEFIDGKIAAIKSLSEGLPEMSELWIRAAIENAYNTGVAHGKEIVVNKIK
jgi:ribosomal protein L18